MKSARVKCLGVVALLASACQPRADSSPERGALVITQQACGSCHTIPGVEQADGVVGPSLAHFASQRMIAGTLPNTPNNLARFVKSPQSVVKGGVMPDQPLSDAQARDVAAYLRTLE